MNLPGTAVAEGDLLWTPDPKRTERGNLAHYTAWLEREHGLVFADYHALWRWSIAEPALFWESIWDHTGIISDRRFTSVLRGGMPHARWFEGATVNYAEHLLRHEEALGASTVFHHASEIHTLARLSWGELGRQVRILATRLRAIGVRPGDCVVAYMPNTPEAAIAMMATVAIGAIWSSAAPEFGVRTVIERFAQIAPVLMFAADGYRFGGRDFEREQAVRDIAGGLPSLRHIIWLPYLHPGRAGPDLAGAMPWEVAMAGPDVAPDAFSYTRVAGDHPLWVLFSSGTTGLPKAIVHSHVGVLIEYQKLMHLHFDFRPGAVMFFYTTTGWVMWNLLLGALLAGAAVVLYDGNPVTPGPEFLWRLAADTGTTSFGASPTFVQMMERAGLRPREMFDLSRLSQVVVAGAPCTPEIFAWFYEAVKQDLWVTSQSGGTEIASGFVGSAPGLAVYAGEIQTRMLGMDVQAWSDDGIAVTNEVGELVVVAPCPSMPIFFWNDPEGRRYQEAYFDVFPGVWRHGDFIKINARGGCYIYGRSDSTLNRHGVRIGTAEIYRTVERVEGVADSIVVCCELPGGLFFMPLFLCLAPGHVLDGGLEQRVASALRQECSPRHVPDRMYAIEGVPYTLTGKKMEVPVRKLLMGMEPERACSRDAMMNPGAIDFFVRFAHEAKDYDWRPMQTGRPMG